MGTTQAYDMCPVCDKERQVRKSPKGWVLIEHRRWTGKEMVRCEGSGKPPGRKNPGSIIFRSPSS